MGSPPQQKPPQPILSNLGAASGAELREGSAYEKDRWAVSATTSGPSSTSKATGAIAIAAPSPGHGGAKPSGPIAPASLTLPPQAMPLRLDSHPRCPLDRTPDKAKGTPPRCPAKQRVPSPRNCQQCDQSRTPTSGGHVDARPKAPPNTGLCPTSAPAPSLYAHNSDPDHWTNQHLKGCHPIQLRP